MKTGKQTKGYQHAYLTAGKAISNNHQIDHAIYQQVSYMMHMSPYIMLMLKRTMDQHITRMQESYFRLQTWWKTGIGANSYIHALSTVEKVIEILQ